MIIYIFIISQYTNKIYIYTVGSTGPASSLKQSITLDIVVIYCNTTICVLY